MLCAARRVCVAAGSDGAGADDWCMATFPFAIVNESSSRKRKTYTRCRSKYTRDRLPVRPQRPSSDDESSITPVEASDEAGEPDGEAGEPDDEAGEPDDEADPPDGGPGARSTNVREALRAPDRLRQEKRMLRRLAIRRDVMTTPTPSASHP